MIEVTLKFNDKSDLSQLANLVRDYRSVCLRLYRSPRDNSPHPLIVNRAKCIDNVLNPLFEALCKEYGCDFLPFESFLDYVLPTSENTK